MPHASWRKSSPSHVTVHFWNTGDKEKTSQTSREKNPITSRDLDPAWLPGFQSQHWEQEDRCFQARSLSVAEVSSPLRGDKNEQGPPLRAFSSRHSWGWNSCRMRGEPRGKLDGTEMGVAWRLMKPTPGWWLCQRHWVSWPSGNASASRAGACASHCPIAL